MFVVMLFMVLMVFSSGSEAEPVSLIDRVKGKAVSPLCTFR